MQTVCDFDILKAIYPISVIIYLAGPIQLPVLSCDHVALSFSRVIEQPLRRHVIFPVCIFTFRKDTAVT